MRTVDKLAHLAGRCAMGDKAAKACACRILREACDSPEGSVGRRRGEELTRMLATKTTHRAAWLPSRGRRFVTRLGRELARIFAAGGGQIHARS